jgi:hypothetical protein
MVGYALKWGEPAFVRGFTEYFERGAFAKSIAGGSVLMCLDHDRHAVVARQDNGTLTLIEDSVGLRVDAMAMYSEAGQDALDSARCRYRAGLSVAFERPVIEWRDIENGRLRIVTDCDLVEISVVRDPAYRSSELFAGRMRIDAFEAGLPDDHMPAARARLEAEAVRRGIG